MAGLLLSRRGDHSRAGCGRRSAALARDDRPWCGRAPPAVVYSYAPGRGGEHAAALLKGYSGVLQTDGYSA